MPLKDFGLIMREGEGARWIVGERRRFEGFVAHPAARVNGRGSVEEEHLGLWRTRPLG